MPTTTNGSLNIAILDSKVLSDLCAGVFYIDISPSVWIGNGKANVLGASVKVTNPYGVIIKNYSTSGFDIYPPLMANVVPVSIPTQANNYQYGNYEVTVQLTDANGTIYTVIKTVSICPPNPLNKTVKYGTLSATLDGNCVKGKVAVQADTPPTYKGQISDSQVNAFTLEYPTSSGIAKLTTSVGSFDAILFEGVYKFLGTICAHYSFGDNIFANVNYKVKREKNIRCLLDKSCVAVRLAELQNQIDSDCTYAEKIQTQAIVIDALLLITVIDGLTNDGQDASDFIAKLEGILGCVCTCNCADGTPIINSNPTGNFSIQGCNVVPTVVGLTTVYTIENYVYTVVVADNGGAITITAPTLNNCTQTQTITFNIATVYSQIKNQVVNSTEFNYWASIINSALLGLDGTCLGLTTIQLNALTFKQKVQAIINSLCLGGSCNAQITLGAVSNTANNVTVTWNNVSNVYEVSAYLDGVLSGTVLYPTGSYTFVGAANNNAHSWQLVAKCSNGSVGNSLNGTFTYYGCPVIAPPVSSATSVSSATCPYNLSLLLNVLPAGITAEWHNLNNTFATSLVANPTAVADGIYFAYAKDSNGCYSVPIQVIIVCATSTVCSSPQNLLVESISGGFRLRFQGAAYPPPSNSYTVKRRITSDPDVSGSYTAIGTPTWDATSSRWQILDATAANNVSYTYRAISNCTSTAPYIDYIFSNISCPVVTLTPAQTSMGYSFTGVGGSIDKYEVRIYENDGITLVHINTHVPAFASPITGTFIYLTNGTTYKVKVRVFIGTYYVDCAFQASTTITTTNYTLSASYNKSIDSVTGTGVPSPAVPSTGTNGTGTGHHTVMSGNFSIVLTGPAVPVTVMEAFVNGVVVSCINISAGAGTYILAITAIEADIVLISIRNGIC